MSPVQTSASSQSPYFSPLRLRPAQPARIGANPIREGLELGPLRATAGPPAGVVMRGSGPGLSDGGRGSTSLFDLPRSGVNLLSKLQAQQRTVSALPAVLGATSSNVSAPTSLAAAHSRQAILRRQLAGLENQSRWLIADSTASRQRGGFGIQLAGTSISIFG